MSDNLRLNKNLVKKSLNILLVSCIKMIHIKGVEFLKLKNTVFLTLI